MKRRIVLTAAAGAAALGLAGTFVATAQTPATPPPPDTPYGVTYIEVAAKPAAEARRLIAGYRDQSRKGAGLTRFEAFERIGYPNHFAIVEQWSNAKAREDNAASTHGKAFRAALAPLLITAYDERPHFALSVGGKAGGTVHAVTHVDIIPPKREEGVANARTLADASRGTPGNLRFDALIQASRPNHFTFVESWQDRAAQSAHTSAAHTKAFRTGLLPMSGSLYDERLYTLMK